MKPLPLLSYACIALLTLLLSAPAVAQSSAATDAPGDYIVARDVPAWFKDSFLDFEEDVAEAAEEGKRVMIYFGQNGCPYCKRLHKTSFADERVLALLQSKFDSVAINIFGDVETTWVDGATQSEKDLSTKLNVQFTPTLMFLDEDGNIIVRVNGYRPPQWIYTALQYVAGKKEQDDALMDFQTYMHENLPAADEAAKPFSSPDKFQPPRGDLHAPGKPTMVFVSQRNCELCEDWNGYLQQQASEWSESFRLVVLNRDGAAAATPSMTEKQWARDKAIAFTPAMLFLDADGKEVFRAEAYLRPFHLNSIVEYVRTGATTTEPEFQRFLQQHADNIRASGGSVSIW